MSVFIDKNTKVMVQGITGSTALFHTKQMLDYGTKILAGVTPGKGGQVVEGVPVFNTVEEAKKMKLGQRFQSFTFQHHLLRLNFRSS